MPWQERQGEIVLFSLYIAIIIQIIIAIIPHVVIYFFKLMKNGENAKFQDKSNSINKIVHTYNFYRSKFVLIFIYTFAPTYTIALITYLYCVDSKFFVLYYVALPLCLPFILYFTFLYIKSFTSYIYITETDFLVYSKLLDKITIYIPLDNIVNLIARRSLRGCLYIAYVNLKKGKRVTLLGLDGWDVVQLNEKISSVRST